MYHETAAALERHHRELPAPIDMLLLLLLDSAGMGQLPAQLPILTVPVELMLEGDGLHLNPVHQDDTNFRIGIHRLFIIGLG